jgi:hypothetical protein
MAGIHNMEETNTKLWFKTSLKMWRIIKNYAFKKKTARMLE